MRNTSEQIGASAVSTANFIQMPNERVVRVDTVKAKRSPGGVEVKALALEAER